MWEVVRKGIVESVIYRGTEQYCDAVLLRIDNAPPGAFTAPRKSYFKRETK